MKSCNDNFITIVTGNSLMLDINRFFLFLDYPDDRAKAVIQEIEELKKKEAKVAQGIYAEQLKNDLITREAVAAAIKNIKNLAKARERSKSHSPGIWILNCHIKYIFK